MATPPPVFRSVLAREATQHSAVEFWSHDGAWIGSSDFDDNDDDPEPRVPPTHGQYMTSTERERALRPVSEFDVLPEGTLLVYLPSEVPSEYRRDSDSRYFRLPHISVLYETREPWVITTFGGELAGYDDEHNNTGPCVWQWEYVGPCARPPVYWGYGSEQYTVPQAHDEPLACYQRSTQHYRLVFADLERIWPIEQFLFDRTRISPSWGEAK